MKPRHSMNRNEKRRRHKRRERAILVDNPARSAAVVYFGVGDDNHADHYHDRRGN